jgi:hypothetical protein
MPAKETGHKLSRASSMTGQSKGLFHDLQSNPPAFIQDNYLDAPNTVPNYKSLNPG